MKIILSANTDWYLYNFRMGLANKLINSGYDVVLVSPSGKYSSCFEEAGFRWIRWNLTRKRANPFEEADTLFSIFRIYHKERPDIVHHHTIKPVLYGSLAARLVGVPKIVNSITGLGYVFQSGRLKARIIKVFVKILYRTILRFSNSEVIFENQNDRQYFIDRNFVLEINTHLIDGVGVDPDRFSPKPEQGLPPMVLLGGRMLYDKGVDVFVEAARSVKTKMDARFVLVGKPDPGNPESIDERVLSEWDDEGVIEWMGWQSDMSVIYDQAHIIAFPTRYGEGVPTFLIEGAACGKPLVASNLPGCQAVIQDGINGYLLSPDEPKALANALERLISSPELRKKMGENSRRIFLEKFTHARINQSTIKVYDQNIGLV